MKADLILKAAVIAAEAHAGQVDKGGKPYINHPLHVACDVASQGNDDNCIIAALLHDVVEDTPVTAEELRNQLPQCGPAIDAVELLTHEKTEPYMDYVKRIRTNEIARTVKMADLRNNMQTERLLELTEKEIQRQKKYAQAYEILK